MQGHLFTKTIICVAATVGVVLLHAMYRSEDDECAAAFSCDHSNEHLIDIVKVCVSASCHSART